MKKIMILGAGIYQVPLIKKARQMGLYTIVASIPGEYPGFAFADKTYEVNTTDRESVLAICRQESVDGICTSGTDVAVATIGYVCSRLGLSGLSEEAADCATDKARMKAAFAKAGVRGSSFRCVSSVEQAKNAASEIGYPVIVKRVDSSGSRGICTVSEEGALTFACRLAQEDSGKPYFLVESMLKGTEIGVDGMIQNGRILFLAPHQKFVYHTATCTIPAGHAFPWTGNPDAYLDICRQTEKAVAALGLDNCSFNADVFVDGREASVIEMGGRTGATCIPELISQAYQFDFYQSILQNALGEPVGIPAKRQPVPCMAKLLMSPVSGMITRIDERGLAGLCREGVQFSLDFPEGHGVEAMKNGTTRIGQVLLQTGSEEELDERIRQVYRCIRVNDRSLEELWKEKQP